MLTLKNRETRISNDSQLLDPKESGYLSLEDFQEIVSSSGEQLTDEEVRPSPLFIPHEFASLYLQGEAHVPRCRYRWRRQGDTHVHTLMSATHDAACSSRLTAQFAVPALSFLLMPFDLEADAFDPSVELSGLPGVHEANRHFGLVWP